MKCLDITWKVRVLRSFKTIILRFLEIAIRYNLFTLIII